MIILNITLLSCRLGTHGVIEAVKTLFRGKNDLILGMNVFLPEGHQIKPADLLFSSEETTPAPVKMASTGLYDAVSFVTRVREAFQHEDPSKYRDFLRILHTFKTQGGSNVAMAEVIRQAKELFDGEPSLLVIFDSFLPDEHRIPSAELDDLLLQQEERERTEKLSKLSLE